MRLQWLDFLATLRERKTWLCTAMLLYATLAIPTLLERPPPHVRASLVGLELLVHVTYMGAKLGSATITSNPSDSR